MDARIFPIRFGRMRHQFCCSCNYLVLLFRSRARLSDSFSSFPPSVSLSIDPAEKKFTVTDAQLAG